jgi:hypothetical protein
VDHTWTVCGQGAGARPTFDPAGRLRDFKAEFFSSGKTIEALRFAIA